MRLGTGGLMAAVVALSGCSTTPGTVERITIVNGTGYDLDVEVAGEERRGWLPVALVEHGSEKAAEAVIDQGTLWVFRFRHYGDSVGEMVVSREELERGGWRVEVPQSIGDRLEDLGRPPSG